MKFGDTELPDRLRPPIRIWRDDPARPIEIAGQFRFAGQVSDVSLDGRCRIERHELLACRVTLPSGDARLLSSGDRLVTTCALSPDARHAAVASDDHTISIWEVDSRRRIATAVGHQGLITACAWSPDGARLASGSYDGDVRIWDGRSGAPIAVCKGHTDIVNGLSWSGHRDLIFSVSEDRSLRAWDARGALAAHYLDLLGWDAVLAGQDGWIVVADRRRARHILRLCVSEG